MTSFKVRLIIVGAVVVSMLAAGFRPKSLRLMAGWPLILLIAICVTLGIIAYVVFA